MLLNFFFPWGGKAGGRDGWRPSDLGKALNSDQRGTAGGTSIQVGCIDQLEDTPHGGQGGGDGPLPTLQLLFPRWLF